ncbi:Crp/Fnr family transcriptional regulator [Chryseobacterium sp.]|uniref:Crp/Fnr family transcriptional regulator n=1 Tax=Chryseobacterium sp. TaxID=1871047 RepID=UPI0035C706E3
MGTLDNIAETLGKIIPGMQDTDILNYKGRVKIEHHKNGSLLIYPGDKVKSLYFIKKGVVRAYYFSDEKNMEKTVYIRMENYFFGDYCSLILNSSARLYYGCEEDCILYKFNFDDVKEYLRQNSGLMKFSLHYTLFLLGEHLSRNEDFIFLNPEERYLKFAKENPEIMKRIPEKHIASLLGVAPASLSRIKRRLYPKN